jgi:putative oxidoreductase
MIAFIQKIDTSIEPLRSLSDKIFSPLLDLGIRLFMANVFFASGLIKFKTLLNDDFGSTIFLFEEVHPVPFISAELASYGATFGEILLPILLAFGLFGRFAAGGLLVMTLVIQYGIPAEYGMQNSQHYFWMLLLMVPLFKGAGTLSLDTLALKFIRKS